MASNVRDSYDAVIFDCDGVLVDSEALSIRGERSALGEFGLHYTPEEYVNRFVGLHDGLFFEQLRIDYNQAHGRYAPDDFEERVLDGRRRERDGLTVIAGADEALRLARATFAQIGVASSSRAHFLEGKLRRMGLYKLAAPHVYSADLVARGKPHPDIFSYTAERLGVEPARCLVLEDSVNGVRAGLAAGMTVWGFVGGGHCYEGYEDRLSGAGAARVVKSHKAFNEVVSARASSLVQG
ncbi:MAG: HAD family phosphatase [Parvularculaceae bacterium]|nr:HAD family phosphatase [Parvularculaceae bacterium]